MHQENMPHLLKIRKYITKYVVEQLSEHFEKQNAVIFRRVFLGGWSWWGNLQHFQKGICAMHPGCAEGSYVSACVKVPFLWCGV